jgi:hypothetical protein
MSQVGFERRQIRQQNLQDGDSGSVARVALTVLHFFLIGFGLWGVLQLDGESTTDVL